MPSFSPRTIELNQPHKPINQKQKHYQPASQRQHFHQEKSLKDLILSKPKHSLIDKIQSQLTALYGVRVIDKTIFYLAWYINHYQSLQKLISNGLRNINASFGRFKNHSAKDQNQFSSHENHSKHLKPKLIRTQRNSAQKNQIQIIMDSYRFKCLNQFFAIQSYSEQSIIKTVVQKLHEKIKKQQIKTVDSRLPSLRKISIIQHHRQPLDSNKIKETNSPKKENLNVHFLPKISSSTPLQTAPRSQNHKKTQPKKHTKKVYCIVDNDCDDSKMQSPILKSFKNENRRNGIHDLNKILTQIEELREILGQDYNNGDDVMKRASSLKARLNSLLCNLIVRPIVKDRQIKAKDILQKLR